MEKDWYKKKRKPKPEFTVIGCGELCDFIATSHFLITPLLFPFFKISSFYFPALSPFSSFFSILCPLFQLHLSLHSLFSPTNNTPHSSDFSPRPENLNPLVSFSEDFAHTPFLRNLVDQGRPIGFFNSYSIIWSGLWGKG